MRPHYVAVLMALLFVISTMAPITMAAPEDEEIPMLRMFIDDRIYSVGEQLNYTLELTANGRHVDPDLASLFAAILMNFTFGEGAPGDIQWLIPVRVSRGIFEGNFNIEEQHIVSLEPAGEGLPLMGKVVFMMAGCRYTPQGGTDPIDTSAMGIAMVVEGPAIQVTVDDHYPSPGDDVTVTVTTTNGTLVDAADVKVNLYSYDGEVESDLGELTAIRQSKGNYKASYTVPVDLDTATMYTVMAGASFPDYNASAYLSPLFATGFMVNFFDLWLQNVSATDSLTEIAVWVADTNGNALQGIDVEMTLAVYMDSGYLEDDQTNTTGANGMAGFSVTHTAAERVDLWGNITDGVRTQSFYMEAIVDNSEPEPPVPDEQGDFLVEPWEIPEGNIFDSIKFPGEEVTTTFRVFNATGEVLNKRLNWYLVDMDGFFDTNYTLLDGGYVVTDANGDFDLTFEVPPSDTNGWLMFEANMWNSEDNRTERMEITEPLLDAGFFPINENIEISVDRIHKDTPVELRASVPLPESYFIGHFFAVFDEETGTTTWGQPMSLGPQSDDFPIVPLQKMGPDIFGIDKQLPEFFPEDQDVAFMVMSVDIIAFKIEMNYVIMGYGESTTKGVDAFPVESEPVHAGNQGYLEVTVENTGAGTDTFTITQESGPDWLEPDVEMVVLEPAETSAFTAYVNVPAMTDEGRYYMNLTVTSESDPAVNKTVETYIEVLVNGVEIRVDPTETDAFREETVSFILTINNTGQGADTYDIVLSGPIEAWASLSDPKITVPENGEAEIVVQVDVPDDADQESYWLNATVTSSDGMIGESITMTVNVQVDGVVVDAQSDLVETFPEDTLSILFDVTNTGQGNDIYTITLEGDPAQWSVLSDETLMIAEGETSHVLVEVTPPGDTDEAFYDLTLVATSSNGLTNDSAMTTIFVRVNGIILTCEEPVKTGYQGGQAEFVITLENTGQNRDVYTLSHEGADWVDLIIWDSPVGVDEGATGNVGVTLTLPDTIAEGIYKMTVTATSEDGVTSDSVELTVEVVVNGLSISLEEATVVTEPGKTVECILLIENTGEGPDTYTVLLSNTVANWTDETEITITVAEGETGTVTITIVVPKDEKGPDAFLNIDVLSEDPTFNAFTQFQVVIKEKDDGAGGIGIFLVIAGVAIAVVLILIVVFVMMTSKKEPGL